MSRPNICTLEDIKDVLIQSFNRNKIIPLVGSGITCGCKASNGTVPLGQEMPKAIKTLLLASDKLSPEEKEKIKLEENLQQLSTYFEDTNIIPSSTCKQYYKDHFSNVKLDSLRKKIFQINWSYVYSLNIDDAIETETKFDFPIICNKPVEDEVFGNGRCVIKLHGSITEYLKYKDECIIFSSKQYARSLQENDSLLKRLKTDCSTNTLLIIGCSLTNEFDLMSLKDFPINESTPLVDNRKIICVKGKPSILDLSNYQQYGITDIVVFDEYEDIYNGLFDIWNESKKISPDELEEVKNLSINKLSLGENNKNYFYQGKSLLDYYNHSINLPAYFILRNIYNTIEHDYKVHVIRGNNYSGKTYFLASILQKFSTSETYYFESKNQISDSAFKYLLTKKNCLFVFDSNSISESQICEIIENIEILSSKKITTLITLSNNDEDIHAFIRYRMKNILSNSNLIKYHQISNKLQDSELNNLNVLLPKVGIPVFNSNSTILDNLIKAEDRMNVTDGQFSNTSLEINQIKDIMLLIILAIKEDITIYDLNYYGVDKEMYSYLTGYPTFFEKINVHLFEKDVIDNSDIKFIINSKYWIRRELGKFISESRNNMENVINAYEAIIQRILSRSSDKTKIRRMYKRFIYFDNINNIFLTEKKGQLTLIAEIYKRIYSLLANDYQFLHQYAKCYLRYAVATKDKTKQTERIKEALEKINISLSIVENEMKTKWNDRLITSHSHIQYTKATIMCEYFRIVRSDTIIDENKVIDSIFIALQDSSNCDDIKERRVNSENIFSFVRYMQRKNYSERSNRITDISKQRFLEIQTLLYNLKKTNTL